MKKFLFGLFCVFVGTCAFAACGADYETPSTEIINATTFSGTVNGSCPSGTKAYVQDRYIVYQTRDNIICGAGTYYKDGSCVAYTTTNCETDYYNSGINSTNTFDFPYNGNCINGFKPRVTEYSTNYLVPPINTQIRCHVGTYYKNGTCASYVPGDCGDEFYDTGVNNTATFIHTYHGGCIAGYRTVLSHQDTSFLLSSGGDKCASDEHPAGTGCVQNATDNCPDGYYSALPLSTFLRPGADMTCAVDYENYADYSSDVDLCRQYLGADMDEICTPQILCPVSGMAALHTTIGVTLPLYGERATNPSLNFRLVGEDSGVCYINLVPGEGTNTINTQDQGGNRYYAGK